MKILNQNQIQDYQKNGFVLLERFFDSSQVKVATNAIEGLLASTGDLSKIAEIEPNDAKTVRRIWAPTERSPIFADLATDSRLLDAVEDLIGPNIVFHHSKLNCKGAKVGSQVEWHQDFAYYPHTNTDLMACLIYLDDADESNGALEVVPRTEYSGLLDHTVDGHFRGKIDPAQFEEKKPVLLAAPAGSVILLHCMTAHFSKVNTSSRDRRTFIPAYRAADAYPIYHGPHAAHNEPKVKLLRGQRSKWARMVPMQAPLPFAEKEFGSLYEIQEGSHLKRDQKPASSGYYISV